MSDVECRFPSESIERHAAICDGPTADSSTAAMEKETPLVQLIGNVADETRVAIFICSLVMAAGPQLHIVPPVLWSMLGFLMQFGAKIIRSFQPAGLEHAPYKAVTFLHNGAREIAVTEDDTKQVSIIDVKQELLLRQFGRDVLKSPKDVAALQDGNRIVVADYTGAQLVMFDSSDGKLLKKADYDDKPMAVSLCPDRISFAVSFYANADMVIADAESLAPLRSLAHDKEIFHPMKAAFPFGGSVINVDYFKDQICLSDFATGRLVDSVKVTSNPFGIFAIADRTWVCEMNGCRLLEVTLVNGKLVTTPSTPFPDGRPRGAAVSADRTLVVVVTHGHEKESACVHLLQ